MHIHRQADGPIALGQHATVNPESLAAAAKLSPATDDGYTGAAVVVANDRKKDLLIEVPGHPVPVRFTLSTYLTREPITDDERAAVARIAAGRKLTKAQKEAAAQAEREAAIKNAVNYSLAGVSAGIDAARKQVQGAQEAAAFLSGLAK